MGTREALPVTIVRVELPVRLRHLSGLEPGTLTLTEDGIRFEEQRTPGHRAAIACARVRSLGHDRIRHPVWVEGGFGFTLSYTAADEPARMEHLRLIIEVESVPLVHHFLERHCSQARIAR